MSVQRALYRQLLRTVRCMSIQGLPCTGCVGLQLQVLCPEAYIARSFRDTSSSGLDDAFHALRTLPKQTSVLQACEQDTRQALQQWQKLQHQWCSQAPLTPHQQLAAAESAAWLLQQLVAQQTQQQLLLEEDVEELQQRTEESIQAAQQQLDDWAGEVRAAAPHAFAANGTDMTSATNIVTGGKKTDKLQQLESLYQVLCQHHRLRCDPFEWVYDGLDPVLLPAVIQKRKGIPLSVAVVAGAVARRLGMDVQLVCSDDGQIPGTAEGPLLPQHMPPEIAARQAGRSLAGAPPTAGWLLQLLPQDEQAWGREDQVFLDVSQKGRLLDTAACIQRYPMMEFILQKQQHDQRRAHNQSDSKSCGVVAVWANMARTMVMAHQRRGESDLVAHWLYQLLALDTAAEEWYHAMQQ